MILPPNLANVTVDVTTSAVANTITTGTLLAAPGAGFRTRLWGFAAAPFSTAQAVVNWYMGPTDGVGGTRLPALAGATFAAPVPFWLPGGVVIATNAALGWEARSALVSALFRLWAFYTTEAV